MPNLIRPMTSSSASLIRTSPDDWHLHCFFNRRRHIASFIIFWTLCLWSNHIDRRATRIRVTSYQRLPLRRHAWQHGRILVTTKNSSDTIRYRTQLVYFILRPTIKFYFHVMLLAESSQMFGFMKNRQRPPHNYLSDNINELSLFILRPTIKFYLEKLCAELTASGLSFSSHPGLIL